MSKVFDTSNLRARAACKALIPVMVYLVALFIPGIRVFALIPFMLPLWVLNDAGIPALGHEVNGFFVPSGFGYATGCLLMWLVCWWLIYCNEKTKL